MRRTLWERPISRVVYEGKPYRLRTAFRRVLQCYQVMGDDALDDGDKIGMCLGLLLYPVSRLRAAWLPAAKKIRLFETIFREYVDTGGKKAGGEKALDFDQDAGLIYAAFAQCYGMDLLGRDRSLHWWKFAQLLGGLPEDTRLMQVVSIRTRPMSKPTKYNAEERQNLLRLKGLYRLEEAEEEKHRRLQDGLRKMAVLLEGMARGKN